MSLRDIAGRFHVSKSAAARHRAHVGVAVVKAAERQAVSIGESILSRLESLHVRANTILDSAERSGDFKIALAAIRELRETLAGIYKLASEAAPSSTQRRISYDELHKKALEFYGLAADAASEGFESPIPDVPPSSHVQ